MSWQLGAFTILALALAGGFAWYERARPDARIVALVATLAALGAIGRIAFAALPNVKPTTDIVLISGYALGGAPGFAVGAIAGLTSNFFFGQGPWTPWQMAAWGATGVIGAGLAIVTRRHVGRLTLALVCGVVGFAFTAFQDVGDWITYSDHSTAQLGVYVGKGVGFDLVHAVGCVLFALAFGPPLTRSIQRFARRLHVKWTHPPQGHPRQDHPRPRPRPRHRHPLPPVAGAALLVVGCVAGWLVAQPATSGGAASPTGYLLSAQNADGGFGAAPGQPSSPLYSGWAALGLAAEGHNPQDVARGGRSLLGYISATAAEATDPGSLERTILVARAAGVSASMFGGLDLVGRLERDIRGDGSVGEQVNLTSFAVLALRAAGVTPPARTVAWLVRQQDSDGGFNFAGAGGTSDVDDTGAALEAIAGSGGPAVQRAVRYIESQQDRDGGFPSQPGGESNAQSTAWAVQGLLATGGAPGAADRAVGFLNSLIAPDGHVRYSRSSDQTPVWVTGEALMALAGKPLPLAAVARTGTQPSAGTQRPARTRARARPTRPAPARTAPSRQRGSSRAAPRTATHAHRARHAASQPSPTAFSALGADAAYAAALALAPVGVR